MLPHLIRTPGAGLRLWPLGGLAAVALAIGCAATSPSVNTSPLDPVYFQSGSTTFASELDYLSVGRAIERLQRDEYTYLLLAGYADPTGDVAANEALSLERAEAIRSLITARSGVDPRRVLVAALGEAGAADLQSARRVEFIFYAGDADEGIPSAEAILAAAGAGGDSEPELAEAEDTGAAGPAASSDTAEPAPAKRSREKRSRGKERERLDIVPTGIAEFDTFFGQVQPLLDSLRAAADGIDSASTRLNEVMGFAAEADPSEALAELSRMAAGSVRLTIDGATPRLEITADASPKVHQGMQAVTELVQALGAAVSSLSQLPAQAQALVAQAKVLPAQVPAAVQSAGLSMAELGKVTKAVKQNVQITAGLPAEAAALITSAGETLRLVAGSFEG